MTVFDEVNALLRDTLRDERISRLLDCTPKLRRLIRLMYSELRRLYGETGDDGFVFTVKSGAERRLLRAVDIFFFEAQGRKVALRTKTQEISFYSSFEQLKEQLPDFFLRCHRGYIINTKKVQGVNFTESVVIMADGSNVPFSRMYRDSVRAMADRGFTGSL